MGHRTKRTTTGSGRFEPVERSASQLGVDLDVDDSHPLALASGFE